MQHLKVSGAVRPLKWSFGVKWLSYWKLLPCCRSAVSGSICAGVNRACSCVKRKALASTWQQTTTKKQSFKLYQIFHGSEQLYCGFLGYDIVYFVRCDPAFRRSAPSPSLRKNINTAASSELSVPT